MMVEVPDPPPIAPMPPMPPLPPLSHYGQSVEITWEELLGRPLRPSDLCDACKRPLGMNVTYLDGKGCHSGCYSLIQDGFDIVKR